jgi:glycosyltransferase involved in cell wall biosynthesis
MSPLKMFEYMASKRPIIASDLPSVREVLGEDDALFVKPDNSEDLAQKIKIILSSLEKCDKIATKALHKVREHYTWSRRAQNIIKQIKGL